MYTIELVGTYFLACGHLSHRFETNDFLELLPDAPMMHSWSHSASPFVF